MGDSSSPDRIKPFLAVKDVMAEAANVFAEALHFFEHGLVVQGKEALDGVTIADLLNMERMIREVRQNFLDEPIPRVRKDATPSLPSVGEKRKSSNLVVERIKNYRDIAAEDFCKRHRNDKLKERGAIQWRSSRSHPATSEGSGRRGRK